MTPVRLTVVLTHPIQYYAPWFRHIERRAPEIALTVVHATEPTPEQQGVGFDRAFEWDVPLTEGYQSTTVRQAKPGDRVDSASFTGLDVPEIGRAIANTSPDVVLDHRLVFGDARPRAVCVPAARRADALSRRFASAERAARLEAAAVERQDADSCCGSSTASSRPGSASTSTCAGTASPSTAFSECRTRWTTSMFAASAAPYQDPEARAAARQRLGHRA